MSVLSIAYAVTITCAVILAWGFGFSSLEVQPQSQCRRNQGGNVSSFKVLVSAPLRDVAPRSFENIHLSLQRQDVWGNVRQRHCLCRKGLNTSAGYRCPKR